MNESEDERDSQQDDNQCDDELPPERFLQEGQTVEHDLQSKERREQNVYPLIICHIIINCTISTLKIKS